MNKKRTTMFLQTPHPDATSGVMDIVPTREKEKVS
jgi:hypothetical protein